MLSIPPKQMSEDFSLVSSERMAILSRSSDMTPLSAVAPKSFHLSRVTSRDVIRSGAGKDQRIDSFSPLKVGHDVMASGVTCNCCCCVRPPVNSTGYLNATCDVSLLLHKAAFVATSWLVKCVHFVHGCDYFLETPFAQYPLMHRV